MANMVTRKFNTQDRERANIVYDALCFQLAAMLKETNTCLREDPSIF